MNLNKPAAWTSHDCVARVRRLLKLKRVGHAGTLDPAATGVLPIAVGRATRLLQYLPGDKAYRATIRLGWTTTTDDLEGEVLQYGAVEVSLDAVQQALHHFQGQIQQVPPRYSAVQVGGQRLYDLARQGHDVTPPTRTVNVHRITVLDWRPGEFPELDCAIACGSGTYIRSIARDLGQMLGCGGTLAQLIRTDSSGFGLDDSLTLDELELHIQQGQFQPLLPEQALRHLDAISLPPDLAQRWCRGQRIAPEHLSLNAIHPLIASTLRVHRLDGQFLGVGQIAPAPTSALVPKVVFEPMT